MTLQLTKSPSVDTGMLIRRSPHDVFEAMVDPAITTRFWYTQSSGRMEEGAEITWEWEMYGASAKVWVQEVERDQRIRFSWEGYDPATRPRSSFSSFPTRTTRPTCASPRVNRARARTEASL